MLSLIISKITIDIEIIEKQIKDSFVSIQYLYITEKVFLSWLLAY